MDIAVMRAGEQQDFDFLADQAAEHLFDADDESIEEQEFRGAVIHAAEGQ